MRKRIQCIGRYVMNGLTLGKGNFARVELATHGVTGCKVAIKIIETRKIKEEYTKANLHREARILGQVRHPNIVRLYETLKATSLYCLVLEYIPGGDMQNYIKSQKEGRLLEPTARAFFRQLVSAIHFLHERGVAHRDLKMENILLDEKHKIVKVIDFGLSNTYNRDDLMKTPCGTLEYAAPELISNDKYGPEVDIWSLGIILYGMVIGKLPFSTHYTDQYRRQKLLVQIEKGLQDSHLRELAIHAISQDLVELLNKLIEPSVALRLPLLDCETHPWVTCEQKLPFVPFSSLPKDKAAKTQLTPFQHHCFITATSSPAHVCLAFLYQYKHNILSKPLLAFSHSLEVIEELAGLLEVPLEKVETTVHESKCDDMSAMFNMMLDVKRGEKGLYDLDFTLKQEVKKERHRKKHHHHKHKSKTRYIENAKTNHISKEQSIQQLNELLPESPDIYKIPLCLWEEFVKATPSILCPDIEASDLETEVKVPHSMNSTRFDLMAVCSAPTWLGGHKRKSIRRRKSPIPPNSPFPGNSEPPKSGGEGEEAAAAAPAAAAFGHEHGNLLSPSQASTQVAQLLRRNSSRRRTRRTSSSDPPSRQGSLSRRRRNRPGTPSTGPHSPHSPTNLNNPEIKIITPKQSPIPTVKRPINLGLKECYTNANPLKDCFSSNNHSKLDRHNTLGPNSSYSRRRKIGVDHLDGPFCVHSDSSNPCSTTNLHEDYSDGSQEMFSQTDFHSDSRTSLTGGHGPQDQSVESRIAAADIRSIVRPKHQYVLRGKVNGPMRNNSCSLIVPNNEDDPNRNAAASPEIIIESMQPNSFANLSDDEKIERQMSCENPKTKKENWVKQVHSELTVPNNNSSENLHSSTELLGAASLKPGRKQTENISVENLHLCSVNGMYANPMDAEDHEVAKATQQSVSDSEDVFTKLHEPNHLVADLYSKREKISLEDKILMHDDIFYLDSSDHNSSQENLFPRRRRLLKESVTSDENESVSAPILLSPRELGLTLSHGDGYGESPIRPKVSSVMPVRHGSTPSVRFVMPSTPIRQMFKTPIARIESFHSDDFEVFTSDVDALVTSPTPSPSPNSIQTPTVPCFQYKLQSRRKKGFLRKSSKNQQKVNKDGHQYAKDCLSKDGLLTYLPEKPSKVDMRHNDPLFSSSSECGSDGQVPDGDKASNASKAKIFPMEKDDEQQEIKSGKVTSQMNDRTKLISDVNVNQNSTNKKHQNSSCRSFLSKQSQESEPKKSAWRRGFAHLLKKKKFSNGTTGNNNNNVDSPSRNRTSNNHISSNNNRPTRNGHARGTMRVMPPNTLDIPITNVEITWSQARVVQNNIKANTSAEPVDHSPAPCRGSPSKPTKVYDFAIVSSDTSKGKHCLLSWKACRDCTFSDDLSSSEDSDGNAENDVIPEKCEVTTSWAQGTIQTKPTARRATNT